MAILSPIVEALVRPMVEARCHVRLCGTVGAELIGDDLLGNKAIAFHQRHQQALGCPFVASLLQDFFKNEAMLIDCAPEPEFFSSAFDNDFVQIPNIAWAALAASQVAGDLWPKLGDPATDCLIGNVDTTLQQHFLDFTQAEIEAQVKPNGVSNDLRRKTVTLETDAECLHRRYLRPTRNLGNCEPVNVTTPLEEILQMTKSMMILTAGPYRSGTDDDPEKMRKNLEMLERAAWPIFDKGHVPMIGEWAALPILRSGGGGAPGSERYEAVMYPTAHRLLAKCDGVLRLPGVSAGADNDVRLARERGIPIWTDLAQIPSALD